VQDLEPPKHHYIQVRALKDCGLLVTMSGSTDVSKDSVHFIKRSDAEPLIRRGFMEELEKETR
jgi:GINS complex subunit 1